MKYKVTLFTPSGKNKVWFTEFVYNLNRGLEFTDNSNKKVVVHGTYSVEEVE